MGESDLTPHFCAYCGTIFEGGVFISKQLRHLLCDACGRTTRAQPVAAGPAVLVLTIVFAENRLLLLKRGLAPYRGYWAPPGGYVEFGESLETAAAREAREEVGITLSADQLIPYGIISLPSLNQVYVTFLAVLDRAVRLEPKLPEALEAGWFSESEYPLHEIWKPSSGFDVSRMFNRVRTGQFDFYQQTDESLRVIMSDSRIVYL